MRQANVAAGVLMCYVAMIGVYYGNAWGGRSLPFMSTRLLQEDGSIYNTTLVFDEGILNRQRLNEYGLPWLTSTYTWASVVGSMAVGRSSLSRSGQASLTSYRSEHSSAIASSSGVARSWRQSRTFDKVDHPTVITWP